MTNWHVFFWSPCIVVTYQIKPCGLVSTNLPAKNFFEILEAEKARGGGGLEMRSEKLPFHLHGLLRAGYAKCYFAHLLYLLVPIFQIYTPTDF